MPYNIDPKTFCQVWARAYRDGHTFDQVVERLSIVARRPVSRKYALNRASFYRSRGVVTLKSFAERDRLQRNKALATLARNLAS